ncbi:hypothetical protein HID58_067944 [Brassica napus]|nr:transcription factor HY5-like [Brassica napus]KAH0880550.1 hypothetical protein HID58_067944 [Brassica napus]CAF1933570.1 unnamed protein product [Brassica napus]VDD46066.1 unnamed protein product [Brassica oleracea]
MSLQRRNGNSSSFSSPKKHKTEESDEEELLMVLDMEAAGSTGVLSSNADDGVSKPEIDQTQNVTSTAKRGRGRDPVDKEYRSHKRLLRNRVSAQEARERKKVYVGDMESRANELQNNNNELEEKISTLMNENTMLRKMLINTRPKADDSH